MKSSPLNLTRLIILLALSLTALSGCFEEAATSAVEATQDGSVENDLTSDTAASDLSADACTPKTCGQLGADCGELDDGCGGLLACGTCEAPATCSELNRCTCVPNCVGKVCGTNDGCEGVCAADAGCCEHECEEDGQTQCDGMSVVTCEYEMGGDCLAWSQPTLCGETCVDGACCTSDCAGKECGDDGCGGSCGTCPGAAPTCSEAGLCVTECVSECDGKECGDDGCGGSCGTCPGAAPICSEAGLCSAECVAACEGKSCGDDGCGGSCGLCPDNKPVCSAAGVCEAEGSGCTDTCDFSGQTQCWNGTWFQQCGDFDVDPCLEWSSAMPCGGTGNCVNGGCEEAPNPPACEFPMAPQEVITGIGATGSGVCDADTILSNDGAAAEFWSTQDNTYSFKGLHVTSCRVIDFGSVCTPEDICVEAWAGEAGCSGDDCSGSCMNCLSTHKVQLEVFTSEENTNESFEYAYSMQIDDTADPGTSFCYGGKKPMRYVLVCRSGCVTPSTSYNAFVDYVWLE